MKRHSGLVRHRHWLAYGLDHGVAMWMPYRVQRIIVHLWNTITCQAMGHDALTQHDMHGPVVCVSCMRAVPDPGDAVIRIWDLDWGSE